LITPLLTLALMPHYWRYAIIIIIIIDIISLIAE
jgi:hypothetical protein